VLLPGCFRCCTSSSSEQVRGITMGQQEPLLPLQSRSTEQRWLMNQADGRRSCLFQKLLNSVDTGTPGESCMNEIAVSACAVCNHGAVCPAR